MSAEDVRALWARVLAGEELLVDDQRRLVDALEADAGLRAELLDDVELDGILRSLGAVRRSGESFVQTLSRSVDRERDATRFVRKVEQRLSGPPPEPPSRRDTPRAFAVRTASRRYARPDASGAGGKAALAAAGLFAAILLFAAASSRRAPSASRPSDEARAVPGRPSEPATVPGETGRADDTQLRRLEKLRDLEHEQERLRHSPVPPDESPEDRRRKIESLERERRAVEADMRRWIEENRPRPAAPSDDVRPVPAPTTAVDPAPAVALDLPLIEHAEGNVYVGRDKARPQPKKDRLAPGQDLEAVGTGGTAVLRYDDGTRVEVQGPALIRDASDARARRIQIVRGAVGSEISPQPPERPMLFESPHAEARILGTTIRMTVTPGPRGETSLEVQKGRVSLKRLTDGAAVEVSAGRFAIVAPSVPLVARKSFPRTVTVNFGPADTKIGPGILPDSGEEFSAERGYGWDGPKNGEPIPGAVWRNPGTGRNEPRHKGRLTVLRDPRKAAEDPLRATDVVAGWHNHAEIWRMPLPNGRYRVTVCVGDATYEQGPHVVVVEGASVWPAPERTRPPNRPFLEKAVEVVVADGELEMHVGGLTGNRKSSDGSVDTILNFITIERLLDRKSK